MLPIFKTKTQTALLERPDRTAQGTVRREGSHKHLNLINLHEQNLLLYESVKMSAFISSNVMCDQTAEGSDTNS